MGLDGVLRGHGPVVAGTVCVVLDSGVYNMVKIRRRGIEDGAANPTDQVLMAKHLLESTLMEEQENEKEKAEEDGENGASE